MVRSSPVLTAVLSSLLAGCYSSVMPQSGAVTETGHFWQISDLHLDLDYSVDGNPKKNCHKDKNHKNTKKLGEFGYPTCGPPWLLIQSAVNAMKKFKSDPDFVLWTGDTSPKLPQWQLTQSKILDLIQRVTVLLNSTFPETYLFPVLGNHDVYPVHQMPPNNKSPFYESVLKEGKWSMLLSEKEQESFLKGGYYSRMIKPGLTVIVLNTNLYYIKNMLTKKDIPDPAGQLKWLKTVLQQEKRVSHSVILVGHVPPGASELSNSTKWFQPTFNKAYLKVIKDYSSTIHSQFYGHEHEDTYRLFSHTKGSTYSSAFIQSSVCPLIGRGKSVNPSIRLYKYDRDTGEILDVFQYYLDLRQANKDKKAEWKLEYQATKEYGIPNLKVASLKNLTSSFNADKSKNFKKYYENLDVGYSKKHCDAECKKLQLCAIKHVDYANYDACVAKMRDFTTSPVDPKVKEVSNDVLDQRTTVATASENVTSYVANVTTHSHHHQHHHPMPLYVFYILAALCALAVVFFMASAIICIRKRRETRYVRVVSLADMSAGYQ